MYRDTVLALEARLAQLREARAEIDTEIESTQRLLIARRRRAPRSSWWWWRLAIGMLTGIGTIGLLGLSMCVPRLCGHGREDSARTRAFILRSAATIYVAQTPGADCPAVRDLIDAGYVDEEIDVTDGWGNPFWIECRRGHVVVRSDRFDGVDVLYEARAP